MGISKVTLDGNTLMDLSSVTVTEADLINNNIAHDNKGDVIVGEGKTSQEVEVLSHTVSGEYTNSNVTYVGGRAFNADTGLTSISFPKVASTGTYTFNGCTNLVSASFPNLETMGNYNFNGCTKLKNTYFPKVKTIGNYAFYNNTALTSISFPEVTTIGEHAFHNCSALVSASFPKLTIIPEQGFNNCKKLKTLDMPNVTQIGHAGLQYCALTELVSTKLQGIASYGMRGSGSLKTVYIPNATWLNEQAISTSGNLRSVYWPRVTSIGGWQIHGATPYLTKIVYQSLTSIHKNGLVNATKVTTFDFGVQMASIGTESFQSSSVLNTLIFRKYNSLVSLGAVGAFNSTPFASGKAGGTIYIPKVLYDHLGDGSSLDYQSATNWATLYGYGTVTWAQIEGSEYEHYYADGIPCSDIYWTLTNATLSSSKVFVDYEQPYTATIKADTGFEFSTLSITMGGIDITEDVYDSDTGKISIQSVTDYVRIVGIATPIQYNWDYEWDYTDGLLTDDGWTQGNWNTGGVATMTEDGLQLTSENSSSITFRRSDFLVTKGVIEVVLNETFLTSNFFINGYVTLSNGTNGINCIFPKGVATIRNVSTVSQCTSIGYTLASDTDTIIRLALDGTSGNIAINNMIKWRTTDVPGTTYDTWVQTTRVGSESQHAGYRTLIKSIKFKNLSEE